MAPYLITVEGNIGVGKTTFLEKLEKDHDVKVIYEPVEEWLKYKDADTGLSIFEMYYNDKTRYSFTFQIMALQTRFENIMQVCRNTTSKYVICERSIFTDFNIFAKLMNEKGEMTDLELAIYKRCHDFMTELCNISIFKYIYLIASPETCIQRIKKRSRAGEENIDINFIQQLHDFHESWLEKEVNVIKVSTECDIDYEAVINEINHNIRVHQYTRD
jgi:deoxyadenosine/deoxycytidine kinase